MGPLTTALSPVSLPAPRKMQVLGWQGIGSLRAFVSPSLPAAFFPQPGPKGLIRMCAIHYIPVTGAKALVYAGGLIVSKACERKQFALPSAIASCVLREERRPVHRLRCSALLPQTFFYPLTLHGTAAARPAAPADDAEERCPGRRLDVITMPGAVSRQNATRLLLLYRLFLLWSSLPLTCFLASPMPLLARGCGLGCHHVALCSLFYRTRSRSTSPPRRPCYNLTRARRLSGLLSTVARNGSRSSTRMCQTWRSPWETST